ncbi:unnamed protein product [Ectocarpus sp. 8 AP-2014]
MMFARVVALACLALGADAFFMGTPLRTSAGVGSSRSATTMKVPTDHPEIEVAEAAALKATKEFGATSPEARLAWDTYEEVAAADNTIATRATLDEDCDVTNEKVCDEYQDQMKELEEILAAGPAAMNISVEQLAKQNMILIEENSRLKASLSTYKK